MRHNRPPNTAILIPARYGSTRFPGKPLAEIGGRSMISRVVSLARSVAVNFETVSVHVTTDDTRIADHVSDLGEHCILTEPDCPSGSDRALSAAKQLDAMPDVIINLQGDAPFTPPAALQQIIQRFYDAPETGVVTPVHQLSWTDLNRLRSGKQTTPFSGTCAVLNKNDQAIWFSKNIIPAIRKEEAMRHNSPHSPVFQHMGLYGYRTDILEQFCALPQGHYEQLEGLEQLRFLENNIPIQCVRISVSPGVLQSGIDTPEDLKRAEERLSQYGKTKS